VSTFTIERQALSSQLVERLAKVHIYLYDMVINATNTQHTYTELQAACPHKNSKPFSSIQSLQPITSERRELVAKWNNSLHSLLGELQGSISRLNVNLTEQVMTDICSNTNYATKSHRCTQIDQHTPGYVEDDRQLSKKIGGTRVVSQYFAFSPSVCFRD
jgi:hypothetical protein